MRYDAVIVASGKGKRANLGYNKVFYKMKNGQTVLDNTCFIFIDDKDCQRVIVVTNKEEMPLVIKHPKVIVVEGGKERKDSVQNGLKEVKASYVLIHDGARPFLHYGPLEKLKSQLKECDACILAKSVVDTVKYVEDGVIVKTIDRSKIYLAETPQAFKTSLIKKAYEEIGDKVLTDDASLLEELGYEVKIVEDYFDNRKLTDVSDFDNI